MPCRSLEQRAALLLMVAWALLAFPAAAQNRLVFLPADSALNQGTRSAPLQVQRQDAAGNPLGGGQPALSVSLSSTSPQTGYSLGSGNWLSSLSVNIPAGQSVTPLFYIRDPGPTPLTLTAQGAGFTDATQAFTVQAPIFWDDFETGTRVGSQTPPGRWDNEASGVAATTSELSAAHRGNFGFRVNDTENVAGAGTDRALFVNTAPAAGSFYFRFWFRISPTNAGGLVPFIFRDPTVANGAGVELELTVQGGGGVDIALTGFDINATHDFDPAGTLTPGAWHLLELEGLGVGTANGQRALWVDGQERVRVSGVLFTGATLGSARVGIPYQSPKTFTGALDFDDFRASSEPPASTLQVATSALLPVDGCAPVTVSLVTSALTAATAPYAFDAALSHTGAAGAFFSDAACSQPTTVATFAAGGSSASAFFRPTAEGAVNLSAAFTDFLPGSTSGTAALLPAVTTLPAINVGRDSATLRASASPNGAAAEGYFRYGTLPPTACTDAYGARAPATGGVALGAGSAAVPFEQQLSGLQPGTRHYVCAFASSAVGTGAAPAAEAFDTRCDSSADCTPPQTCNASNACVGVLGEGAPCGSSAECASGECSAAGLCCVGAACSPVTPVTPEPACDPTVSSCPGGVLAHGPFSLSVGCTHAPSGGTAALAALLWLLAWARARRPAR